MLRIVTILLIITIWSNATAQQVYFSPNGGALKAIVNKIDSAHSQILIRSYSFTSAPIADALCKAISRGVVIKVIADRREFKAHHTKYHNLIACGIAVRIDSSVALQHSKYMIIDSTVVITGSYNFTIAAEERNAENLLIFQDAMLAKKYLSNWLGTPP
jgi:phosphatidylserine/phosphatidylglycerophosphate/cardiolipin synthase-like enzyme